MSQGGPQQPEQTPTASELEAMGLPVHDPSLIEGRIEQAGLLAQGVRRAGTRTLATWGMGLLALIAAVIAVTVLVDSYIDDDGTRLSKAYVTTACHAVYDTADAIYDGATGPDLPPAGGADRVAAEAWQAKVRATIRPATEQTPGPGDLGERDHAFIRDVQDYATAAVELTIAEAEVETLLTVQAPVLTRAISDICDAAGIYQKPISPQP